MDIIETVYCKECGDNHPKELPHNVTTSQYQVNFFNKHGKFPTWDDALAHCTEEMKISWKASMERVRKCTEEMIK